MRAEGEFGLVNTDVLGFEGGGESGEAGEDAGVVGVRPPFVSRGKDGESLPSNLAARRETNQARTTFSLKLRLAAKTLRSESIGYSSLRKACSKLDSVVGSRTGLVSRAGFWGGSSSGFETSFLFAFCFWLGLGLLEILLLAGLLFPIC